MTNVLDMTIDELRAELSVTESFTTRGYELITAIELKAGLVWDNVAKKYSPRLKGSWTTEQFMQKVSDATFNGKMPQNVIINGVDSAIIIKNGIQYDYIKHDDDSWSNTGSFLLN